MDGDVMDNHQDGQYEELIEKYSVAKDKEKMENLDKKINLLKRKGAEESFVSFNNKKSLTCASPISSLGIFGQACSSDVAQNFNELVDQKDVKIKCEPIDDDLLRDNSFEPVATEPVQFINIDKESIETEIPVNNIKVEEKDFIPDINIKMESMSSDESLSSSGVHNDINVDMDNFYAGQFRSNEELDNMIEALESKEQTTVSENLELMNLKAMRTQKTYMEAIWTQVRENSNIKRENEREDQKDDLVSFDSMDISFEDLDCRIWAIELKSPKHRTPAEKVELKKLKARRRSRKCRENMTEEEKEARKKKSREHIKAKRENMTEEQKEARRKRDREHIKIARENMTEEQKEERRRKNREQIKIKRENMSEQEKEERRKKSREQIKIKRRNMSEEQKEERRRKEREQIKIKRHNMSEEEKEARRKKEREQIKIKRDNMTEEQKEERRKREREQLKIRRANVSEVQNEMSNESDFLYQHQVPENSGPLSWNNLPLHHSVFWSPTAGFPNSLNLL